MQRTKRPQQKSIVGFLQQGSSGPSQDIAPNRRRETVSHLPMEMDPPACSHSEVPRLRGFPWTAGQTGLQEADVAGEKQPQQSFFQRAYTKKLQLQAKSLSGEDKGHRSVCSGFNQRGTDNLKSGDSAMEMHESERGLLGLSRNSSVTNVANVSVAPPEARVSTSGCAATKLRDPYLSCVLRGGENHKPQRVQQTHRPVSQRCHR